MPDELPPTVVLDRAPGDGNAPSGRLPGPHNHIKLTEFLGGKGRDRQVYRATSPKPGEELLIVELLFCETVPFSQEMLSGPRRVLDLRPWQSDDWPPLALVTCLPAALPAPYERITLLDFIGLGGMGQVWMAESPDYPGQSLVVKLMTLPPDRPEYVSQFIEEVKAGLDITHEYIVRTHQLIDWSAAVPNGWPPVGMVMQRYEISLAAVLVALKSSGKRLPQDLAIEWSRNLLDALGAFHLKGRVHRDFKPGNVLLQLAEGTAYYGVESLPDALAGSHALLSDLGAVCRMSNTPLFPLGQDGFKAPELFDPPGSRVPRRGQLAHPAEDRHAFGLVLRMLAKVVDGSPAWLGDVASQLTHADPSQRPKASDGLRYQLSPDWRLQEYMKEGGWKPEAHPLFTGRDFVFTAFEEFAQRCAEQKHGGVFLIEGEAGIGKTALVTQWVGRGAPHPAFFFRKQESRTEPWRMAETLFYALCKRYQVNGRALPDRNPKYADELAALLQHIAGEKLASGQRLLLFVDGVDEADDPQKVIDYLPKRDLPAGVFLIVCSRPRIGDRDHLKDLREARAGGLELTGDDSRNLKDLEKYLLKRLDGRVSVEQARNLSAGLGGIFQLAIYFVEEMEPSGTMTIDEAVRAAADLARFPVARRVFAWYQQSWERIMALAATLDEREYLTDFVCLLAAAQAPLGEKQVLRILEWKSARRDWALRLLRWLIDRRVEKTKGYEEAFLQLRHQSVYDFLVSVEHEGPARDGLEEMHARIGRHYVQQARSSRGSAEQAGGSWRSVEPYGVSFAARHLIAARDPELLAQAIHCVTDLGYLDARLNAPGTV